MSTARSKTLIIDGFLDNLRIMSTQAVMRSQAVASKLRINPTDLESMEVLFRLGRMTAGRLAEETGLTTGAVTGVVDRLTKAGFAWREHDDKDRRKVYVVLNMKKIQEDVIPLYKSISKAIENLCAEYSNEQLELIADFLKRSIQVGQEDLRRLADKSKT